jgi:hypothetical protein
LDIKKLGVSYSVVLERVRAKAYHNMRNHLVRNDKKDPELAKEDARIAARYHIARWKREVG